MGPISIETYIKRMCKIFLLFLLSCHPSAFYVERVIDGDTFVIENGTRVRLLGIDAPEKGDPFWMDAKKELEKLVLYKKVRLEYDLRKYDKYGRLLAHVFVGRKFVNEELVRKGLAWVYVIPPNFKYSHRLIMAQERAKSVKIGVWGKAYYVASKRGRKFHVFYCPSAKRISWRNRIIFRSKEEALKRGYKPAKDCNP